MLIFLRICVIHTQCSHLSLSPSVRSSSPSECHELPLTQLSSSGAKELTRHEPAAGAELQPVYSNGAGARGPGAVGGWAAAQAPSRSGQTWRCARDGSGCDLGGLPTAAVLTAAPALTASPAVDPGDGCLYSQIWSTPHTRGNPGEMPSG